MIIGLNDSPKLFNDDNIKQYFIDRAYKCVPHSIEYINVLIVLIVLICHNPKINQFELCLLATLNNKEIENYINFYKLLKTKYHFCPKIITYDFALANINAIKEVYKQ